MRKLRSPDNPGIEHKIAHWLAQFGLSVGIDVLLLGHSGVIVVFQLLLLVQNWRSRWRFVARFVQAQASEPLAPDARAPRHACSIAMSLSSLLLLKEFLQVARDGNLAQQESIRSKDWIEFYISVVRNRGVD